MSLQKLVANYAAYNLWANETLLTWLKSKPKELLEKEVPSSFPTIVKTLNHIWAVEEFWYKVITGKEATGARYLVQNPDAAEVLSGIVPQSKTLADHVATLSEAALEERLSIDFPWIKGELPRYECLQHAINHSTYHRGQIVTIGRNLGFTDAPVTDYNFFNLKRG
jgi:uncharacterized damage-inducible protein DinB